jgi:hypothetical protein
MSKRVFIVACISLVVFSTAGMSLYLNTTQPATAYIVSPTSRFNPIFADAGSGFSYSAKGRITVEKFMEGFRFDANFGYLSAEIVKALNGGLSAEWVKTQTRKLIPKKEFVRFSILHLYKRDDSFYLPYEDKRIGYPLTLRYCLADQPVDNPTGAPSFILAGARIFVENPIRDADELDERLSGLDVKTGTHQSIVKRQVFSQVFSDDRRSIAYLNELEFPSIVKNEADLKAIRAAISQNYKHRSNIREIFVDLPEPALVGGRRWSRVCIKGAAFDESEPVFSDTGVASHGISVSVTDKGALIYHGSLPASNGRMAYRKAKEEFRNQYLIYHNDYLSRSGVFASAPLGYGIFPDAPLYKGEKPGYVILGVDDNMPDRARAKPVPMAVLAKTLRRLNDAGFTHPHFYFGNVTSRNGRIYLYDLDSVEYIGLHRPHLMRLLMSEVRDIFYIYMKGMYYRFSSLRFSGHSDDPAENTRRAVVEREGSISLKEFVGAYFYDAPLKMREYLAEDGIIKPMEKMADKFIVKGGRDMTYGELDESGKSLLMLLKHNIQEKRGIVSPGVSLYMGEKPKGPGYIDVNDEVKAAVSFRDTLKIYARSAAGERKTIIIGIDLSWIPQDEISLIQPVLNYIRGLSRHRNFPNVIIVRGKGADLAKDVLRESKKSGELPSRVVILANEATAFDNLFGTLRGAPIEEKLLLIGVSSKNITGNDYIRIFTMLEMALKIAYNGANSVHNPFIDVIQDPNNRKIYYFKPRKEPLSGPQLKNIYMNQAIAA